MCIGPIVVCGTVADPCDGAVLQRAEPWYAATAEKAAWLPGVLA